MLHTIDVHTPWKRQMDSLSRSTNQKYCWSSTGLQTGLLPPFVPTIVDDIDHTYLDTL
jgi:hypothetical protein